ncbi:hypothetical protein J3R30DRAFT_3405013 [Lentinula aciculospora]|uniref:Uncharacterized protein n=1 Tax=Lentinula aciculospora TaxID=153920 RepID=A0A9W9A950_9AGAR|nr:hypothetical protein J3R30DRAFT_3405013 [Lentinula aciculospora]
MYAPYLEEYSARRLVTHEVAPPTPVHDSLTNDSDGLSSGYRSRGWFGKRQSVDGAREPTLKSRSPLLKRLSLSISKSSNSDNNSGIPTSETSVSPVNLNTVVSSSPLTQKPLASITQKIYTNVATMSSGERLAAIARLQRFDGGFSWSTALFSLLKLNLDTFDGMKKELSEQGIEVDIAATVLAWSWLEKNGGYEATDMAKKAGEWVGIQLGPTDTAAEKEILKDKVLTVIPLS